MTAFWTDEFMIDGTYDKQQWKSFDSGSSNSKNAMVMDGHLELMLSDEIPSKDFENPPYSGVKLQAKWNSVTGSEIKDQMPKYGYYETKLKARALRTHILGVDYLYGSTEPWPSSNRPSRACM